MGWLGPASFVITAVALLAALWVMLRTPKQGTPGERGLWVGIVFLVPVVGPLLYIIRMNNRRW